MGPGGALLLTGALVGLAVYIGTRPAPAQPLPVVVETTPTELEAGPILRQVNTSNTTTPPPAPFMTQQAGGLL